MNKLDELHNWYEKETLKRILDEVIFQYTCYILRDNDRCGASENEVEHLFVLKSIQEAVC